MGIHELLVSDDAIRLHIRQRSSAMEILETSLKGGMRTLRQDGIDKVLQGSMSRKCWRPATTEMMRHAGGGHEPCAWRAGAGCAMP